jgi:bacillithiol system protein YtxJ
MDWHEVTREAQVDQVIQQSQNKPQALLKHSTRCSISGIAKSRLEQAIAQQSLEVDWHLLNVVKYRQLAQYVEEKLNVQHESPQLLVLVNGECVLDQDHMDIQLAEVAEVLAPQAS